MVTGPTTTLLPFQVYGYGINVAIVSKSNHRHTNMSENEFHECQVFQFGHAREESAKSLHKTKCLSIKIAQRLSAISSQASHTVQQLCGNQVVSNEGAGQSKYCTLAQIASVFGCQLAPVVFVAEGALFLGSSNSSGKGKLCNLKR